MPILVSPGEFPPRPRPDDVFFPVRMTWSGVDGSVWELSGVGTDVRVNRGLQGWGYPGFARFVDEPPGLHGTQFRGTRVGAREVFWPVRVRGWSTAEWLANDAAWWRSVSRDVQGTWTVQPPDLEPRSLRLRLAGVDESADGDDPALMGRALYGVRLVADDPFWAGGEVQRTFKAAAAASFFEPSAGGVVAISAGNTLDQASIPNPGDEPAWPVWEITGPFTSVTVGVAGKTVVVPFAMTLGQWLRIDTRPDVQTVVDQSGADRVANLGAVSFAAVPPGASVPLTVSAAGTGEGMSVTASLTPRYARAW